MSKPLENRRNACSAPPATPQIGNITIKRKMWRALALGFVFLWFFVGGIAHFAFTEREVVIVPPWLPQHRLLVLTSGVFELLGAIGLLLPRTRNAAGRGLILLTLAVTPANVYMWQTADHYPAIPAWLLFVRLPLQLLLLIIIWWATRPPAEE